MKIVNTPLKRIEHGKSATWLELFYDLAFVAGIGVIVHTFKQNLTIPGLINFLILFTPLFLVWIEFTFYANRFETSSPARRVIVLLQMMGIIGMAIFAQKGLQEGIVGYLLTYSVVKLLLIALYAKVAIKNPEAKPLAKNYIIGITVELIIWLSILFYQEHVYILAPIAILVEFITPFFAKEHEKKTPLNTTHLPERFGLFSIIILGEILLALISVGKILELTTATFIFGASVMTIAFSLWWLYFDNLEARITKRIQLSGQIWIYTHMLWIIGITVFSVGIQKALQTKHELLIATEISPIVVPLALAIFALSIFELVTIKDSELPELKIWKFVIWNIFTLAILAIPILSSTYKPVILITMLASICATVVIFDMLFAKKRSKINAQEQ